MFDKILVALGLSDAHQSVFDTALFLAQTNHAKLILLQIIPFVPEDESLLSVYEEPWQKLQQRGLEVLRSEAMPKAYRLSKKQQQQESMSNLSKPLVILDVLFAISLKHCL